MNQWSNELYNFTNNNEEIDWEIKDELKDYLSVLDSLFIPSEDLMLTSS